MIWFGIYDKHNQRFLRDDLTGRMFRAIDRGVVDTTLERAQRAGLTGLEVRQLRER